MKINKPNSDSKIILSFVQQNNFLLNFYVLFLKFKKEKVETRKKLICSKLLKKYEYKIQSSVFC